MKTHMFRTVLVLGLSLAIQSANAGDVISPTHLQPQWTTAQDSDDGGNVVSGYQEVSAFFNVREAYSNVEAGEWEWEVGSAWETSHDDDDFSMSTSIKYGYTDTMHIELELLPVVLFDGGDMGAGDLELTLFNQFSEEAGDWPAFAAWLAARFPTGEGSNGVDGELHLNFTKALGHGWRGHLEGFGRVNDGEHGDEGDNNHDDVFSRVNGRRLSSIFNNNEGRRSFQWGTGVGLDYACSDNGLGIINYLNESSETQGDSRVQTLELGYVHHLNADETLKFAVDINLDGHDSSGDFGAKVLWSLEF